VGELQNKGVEVLLTATPVKGALTWDVSLNFAKNVNKVVKLIEGTDALVVEEPRTRTVFVKHIVGHPFGEITGYVQQRSPDGQPVFEANGAPVQSTDMAIIGNGLPNWTGGLNNTLSYKNFNLSFLIDFKFGGQIYSGTNVRLTEWGLSKESLIGRNGELAVSGVTQNGTDANGNPIYESFSKTLTGQEAQNYWNQTGERVEDHFVFDASFGKLRQLTFGYNFPAKMLSKTPFKTLNLSFVGRNLAILWKHTPNIDPESSYSSGNGQGLDYFGMPQSRNYGFNLRVGF
jgi:hypothetical protein